MLQQIEITENSGWLRYTGKGEDPTASPEPITPGSYYVHRTWMRADTREQFKQQLAPIAAKDPAGRFAWLLPAERWVKCLLDGFLPPELTMYGQVEDTPANREELARAIGKPVEFFAGFRTWQLQFGLDWLYAQEQDKDYRRAAIVKVGGGKTLEGLIIAAGHKDALVLAPRYCWDSWTSEAKKWGLPCPRLSTYESAHKQSPAECLILDEALLAANPNTQRHAHALLLSRQARTVLGLTGTPQSTTPMDLRWLRVVFPGCVPAVEKPWRFLFGRDTKLVEVRPGQEAYVTKTWDQEKVSKFVAPYVMVVDPAEILRELPEIQYTLIHVAAPPQYELILKGAATEKSKSKAIAQARMCTDGKITDDNGRILANLNTNKLDAIEQYVGNLGEPVVIFARWSYMVDALAERFAQYNPAVLRGGADHETEVARFRNGETDILIANACISQGMNLQERARVVIFASNSLKPTDREQAIGRVYRPGQKRGVIVVDVVADDTLDVPALNLLTNHKDKSEAYIVAGLEREFERQRKG